ncbi:hypothetical protein [Paraburkholderia humisilvae]|uniref:Uncharacterized protein n=1 Tax=Paraburkholderia humisilvae TaxID=627669 RepID=A0A6J5DKM9_9BURK|nr:hypothetical protein [Paraburkholderia humisilvae]CAB3753997.1 hypothetical protein LMG29542_02215 [Paraburkholderia humisilvae]
MTDALQTDLPQADDADPATVFTAALSVLFKTHPNPALLLAEWEKIASQMPLIVLKNGAKDVSHNANVVIAQGLLHIARMAANNAPPSRA